MCTAVHVHMRRLSVPYGHRWPILGAAKVPLTYKNALPPLVTFLWPALPSALCCGWRCELAQVDPRWRPYIGDLSWEDIQKQINPKKHGKRKKAGKGKATSKAASKAAGAAGESASAEAEKVIAAYTGGLDQR